MREIAIVGGGPAGSLCGERLASAGFRVTLFDEHLAWEKPCGGGLTHKAIERYPFLLDNPHPKKLVRSCELIASSGHRARLELDHPIVIYSREVLNGLLLDRAGRAGCRVVQSRVTDLRADNGRVRLKVNGDEHSADFVVIAAGARNPLLPETTPLAPHDLELTVGYFVPADEDVMKVKFLPGFEGYLWSFPRAGHLSVGICGKLDQNTSQQLKKHLGVFLREENLALGSEARPARFFSHVLPSPRDATLRRRKVAGRNWALVGDAAAWVDPLTGEGLYYAMRSGELLAESLVRERPEEYPHRVRAEYANDLAFAAKMARRFFAGRFLAGAVAVRMIQFIERSPTFRAVVRDLFSGAQNYASLKRRLWAQFGITFAEVLGSILRARGAGPRQQQSEASS